MKVLTFNIQDGAEGREAQCFAVFRHAQLDVILLQEVVDPAIVYHWAADLGMHVVVAGGKTRRHVAILSRYPILESHSLNPVPSFGRDFLEATIEYAPQRKMALFSVHLAAQPLFLFEWLRLRTLKAVLRRAEIYSTIPCVIAGDFNAVSPADTPIIDRLPLHLSVMLRLQRNRYLGWVLPKILEAGFVDCFRSLHAEAGYTLPATEPKVRFDYIFVNIHLNSLIKSCSVLYSSSTAEAASDHLPVMAEFAL